MCESILRQLRRVRRSLSGGGDSGLGIRDRGLGIWEAPVAAETSEGGRAFTRATGGTTKLCVRRGLAYTGIVKVWLDLPDAAVAQLAEEGQDLSRAALEALAIDAYRMNRITGYQLCQLLEIPSRHDLDGFLKPHDAPLEYTIEDIEREGATGSRLWKKRQAELSTEPNRERRPE